MNGIFNNNFLIGFLLAKDLPRNEALTVGLAAGQSKTIVGPLLLKPQIDARTELETKNASLQGSLNTVQTDLASLRRPLVMDMMSNNTYTLSVSGAVTSTLAIKEPSVKEVQIVEGKLSIQTIAEEKQATLSITTDDGVVRDIIVNVKKTQVS
ncbi:MAG: hypothetical protein WBD99_10775 [Thermodesulfobacteriota bacterium]